MARMEKIGEAILDKVKAEADSIIKEAKGRAKEEVDQAKKRQLARLEEEKAKVIQEAREEATRIEAQASVKARQELSRAKADVIDEIISGVKKAFSDTSGDKGLLVSLVKEGVDTLGIDKGRVYVSPRDVSAVKKLLDSDKQLASKIVEVKECDCVGGVIVENIEGKVRIDNTYNTRLEMLLPQLLPEIGKELF